MVCGDIILADRQNDEWKYVFVKKTPLFNMLGMIQLRSLEFTFESGKIAGARCPRISEHYHYLA